MIKNVLVGKDNPKIQIEIDYPPNFESRYGRNKPVQYYINEILQKKTHEQHAFLDVIKGVKDNFQKIAIDLPENSLLPRWNQPWLPPLDAIALYTVIADRSPKYYVEIGSGNSTKFALQAIKDFDLPTKIISIDPVPRTEIDDISNQVYRVGLQDCQKLKDIFGNLSKNDVVFFDGSHRCFTNSDVTVFFLEIIPMLSNNVICGIHDIFWPNDYPVGWKTRYYNEQYIVGAYILAQGNLFPLLFSTAYMTINKQKEIAAALDEDFVHALKNKEIFIGGASIWFDVIHY